MNRTTTVALAVLAVAVLTAGSLPAGVLASHEPESTDYTVETDDPTPGAEEVTYTHRVDLTDNFDGGRSGFKNVTEVTFSSHAGDIAPCDDEGPLGVSGAYNLSVTEPQDDGGGQEQDEFDSYEAEFSSNSVTFSIDDSSKDYVVGERLQLDLDSCVTNPENEGWYQVDVTVEGNAFGDGEDIQLSSSSHYYPICESCENDSAARAALGPPPSEPTPTPTPTPTATQTPTPTPTPEGPTATATPPDGDDEPTPTTTEPADDDQTATEPADDDQTATASPTATAAPEQELFGVDPMIVVAVVAAISIGLAAFGATRL
jgi:hypothetical protein